MLRYFSYVQIAAVSTRCIFTMMTMKYYKECHQQQRCFKGIFLPATNVFSSNVTYCHVILCSSYNIQANKGYLFTALSFVLSRAIFTSRVSPVCAVMATKMLNVWEAKLLYHGVNFAEREHKFELSVIT